MVKKSCKYCNQIKKLEEFVIDKKTEDGRRNMCKECFNKIRREKRSLIKKTEKDKLKMLNSLHIRECKTCKKIKPFKSFVANKLCSYGIEYLCINCRNDRLLDWRIANPEKKKKSDKLWRMNNLEHTKNVAKQYREKNKDKRRVYEQKRAIIKREELKISRRKYREKNKDKINKYFLDRRKSDIQFDLACKLRSRINTALKCKGVKKKLKTLDMLGCSFEELKSHIESKFTIGMSWDKMGRDGIHIDHVKPLAMYDLSDEEQLREACHYTNLQPLWQHDNLSKGARWIG